MAVFNLPEDIFADGKSGRESLIFHHYTAPAGSFSGRSILNKNAVSLVISGEKTIQFAEKKVEVREGEFHFLSAGNCLVSMKPKDRIQFRSILIFFGNEILTDFFLKYDRNTLGSRAEPGHAGDPYIAFRKDAFIDTYIGTLLSLLRNGSLMSVEMRRLKFEELMLYLLEKHPRQIRSFRFLKDDASEDLTIRRVVEHNLTTRIGLEEIAFLCNVSLSTFKRRFAKLYGAPPNRWILQKRMEAARDMLLHGREKPSEVFHKVGYLNHSSFTQSFKQVFGITPKEFQSQRMDVRR
ncbi:MAG: transcriptional regulator, AraC family [Fibrobacteres bacterium]|nr:transcriptional regulator, AraC family [Fibrobacterota bacterium]